MDSQFRSKHLFKELNTYTVFMFFEKISKNMDLIKEMFINIDFY